jgi:phosphatidylglycerol---prolipoprotein diacylglyceryl transferase
LSFAPHCGGRVSYTNSVPVAYNPAMLQIVFRIPFLNLPIYGYGLMLVVAFLACVTVAKAMARRVNLDGELFVNAALIALITGVAGARLSHVLENWGTFTNPERSFKENFLDAINIRGGGLTFYGGFILATPCCIAYALRHRLPLLKSMDIVAVVLMVGLGIGRIGCYLNGCCYGEICTPRYGAALMEFPYFSNAYIDQFNRGLIDPPPELLKHLPSGGVILKDWGEVRADGLTDLANQQKSLPVQPTQLYSCFTALLLAALLYAYWTLPHVDGRVFALMMLLEGPSRFILELIRVEPAVIVARIGGIPIDMSLSMVLGLAIFFAGGMLWLALGWRKSLKNQQILAPAH